MNDTHPAPPTPDTCRHHGAARAQRGARTILNPHAARTAE